jgi:hypothetical protein
VIGKLVVAVLEFSGRWPRKFFNTEGIRPLCRVSDKVALSVGRRHLVSLLVQVLWSVGLFTFAGAFWVCSFHSSRGVFSPAMVEG